MSSTKECEGCYGDSTKCCQSCRLAYYCGTDHQRRDWLIAHKYECGMFDHLIHHDTNRIPIIMEAVRRAPAYMLHRIVPKIMILCDGKLETQLQDLIKSDICEYRTKKTKHEIFMSRLTDALKKDEYLKLKYENEMLSSFRELQHKLSEKKMVPFNDYPELLTYLSNRH